MQSLFSLVRAVAGTFVLFLVAMQAHAGLVVFGDVDAMNVGYRTGNYGLLENIRGGATNIVWADGGSNYVYDGRHSALQNQWSNAGATITFDQSNDLQGGLNGAELLVLTSHYYQANTFSAAAATKVADFLSAGGEVLYVTQLSGGVHAASHNQFLADIGSTIAFTTGYVYGGNFEVLAGTPYYAANTPDFQLGGVTALAGGTAVVAADRQGNVGVVYDAIGVPAPAGLGLFLLGLIGLRSAGRR